MSTADIVTVSAFVGNGTYQSLVVNCPVAGYTSNDNLLSNSNVVYNSITHYDSYDYQGVKAFNSSYSLSYTPPAQNTETLQVTDETLGFVTGEKIRIIDNDNDNSNDQFIFSTVYYDEKGRSIQTLTANIKGGTDYETNQFDFAGKLLSTYVSHSDGADTYTILSRNEYDKDGRLIKLYKNFNNSFDKQLAEYSYDELGQLKQKRLAPGYTASGKQEIESQNYIYDIHGSLTGINKDYALNTDNSAQWDHYFGLYLGYDNKDNLFSQPQLTGNITGSIWKSQGDNSMRKYDYTYDNLGRFKTALFLQKKRPSDSWSNTEMDFSVYADYEDLNGNLKSLKQMGVVPGTSGLRVMDDLRYYYKNAGSLTDLTGNQLSRVDDNLSTLGNNNGILGDFKDHNNIAGTDDYDYDKNGNLTRDDNKNISSNGIVYNYLNKPIKIVLDNKSTVEYTYDASGEKLSKKVTNNVTGAVVYTHYMGDFVYGEVNGQLSLKYILHEEGRVKIITPLNDITINTSRILNNANSGFSLPGGREGVFEYFIKDHLSNTRMVLTEEVQQESYRAYMESSYAGTEEQLFGKVTTNPDNTVTIPSDNELKRARVSNTSSDVSVAWPGNNTEFVKLSASSGKVMGPNILLKVMAGDEIRASANYFYYNNDPTSGTSTPVNDAINSLIAALTQSNITGAGKTLSSDVNSDLTASGGNFAYFINTSQPNSGPSTAPKAYLNIVFLDEQFKFVPGEGISGTGSIAQRVSISNTGGVSFDPMMQKAPKNGWVYVYLSNESNEPVYFDDFFVTQDHRLISEENHYYPHGLKIAGITSHAFNKLENKYGYQGSFSEEEEESGFDEFFLRMFDPQIGRWNNPDPLTEFANPYIGMGNDPCNLIDPNGGFVSVGGKAVIGPPGWKYPLYKTMDAAAFGWSKTFQSLWKNESVEYSALIYEVKLGKETYYGFTRAVRFPDGGAINPKTHSPSVDDNGMNYHRNTLTLPAEAKPVAQIHMHYRKAPYFVENRNFSVGDQTNQDLYPGYQRYLLNTYGELRIRRDRYDSPYGWTIAYNFDLTRIFSITGKIEPIPFLVGGKYSEYPDLKPDNYMDASIRTLDDLKPVQNVWVNITMKAIPTIGGIERNKSTTLTTIVAGMGGSENDTSRRLKLPKYY